jgi:fatty-acyl-CoA synthase
MIPKALGNLAIGRIMKNAAIRFRDREALYCLTTGRKFSYLQLNERTNQLANALMCRGLNKGDAVAYLVTNRSEIVETMFAIAKAGFLGLPLNYRLIAKEIIQMMSLTDVKAMIFEDTFTDVADYVRQQLPGVKTYICVGKDIPKFALAYDEFIARSSEAEPKVEIQEEDDFCMNLTSGTTGLPKSYLLTHYANATVVNNMAMMFRVTGEDTVLTVFPMFGMVGFAWTGMALYTGARHVIMNFEPKKALETIQSEKVTISNWVPSMATLAFSIPGFDNYDLSSLRALVFAGAAFPTPLQEQVRKRITPDIYEYYGMQETGPIVYASPKDKIRKPASIGKVALWVELRIVDASGNDVPAGIIGEVVTKTLTGTSAYYKNEKQTKETFKDGWCHTGDLGYLDEEGYFYIAGRIKEMIVSGGQNIYPAEIENTLIDHPAVADCTVIGLPDEKWGEAVTAVIVKKPGVDATDDDVIAFCRKEMAGFKIPKRIIWYEGQIPRTPTGKVTKYVLVEKYSKK